MSIVVPVDVPPAFSEDDPTRTYSFKNVKGCSGKYFKEISIAYNAEWAAYWTEDHRVCPPAPPPTLLAKIKRLFRLPNAIMEQIAGCIVVYLPMIIFKLIALLCMPITASITACLFDRSEPVVTLSEFYYWLKRNGFTSDEMKQVKVATKGMTMHAIAHKLTEIRAVEVFFKLQSIEKQKLVIVVLQQSMEAIAKEHEKKFEIFRIIYTAAIFSWGAQDAHRLGDVIAKNGRMCSRGEDARKKADWEQRVASKVNLRVNAVLRCINTIASEGRYSKDDAKMTDLVRTVNRTDSPVDWNEFVAQNRNHENRLLAEIHTAATYVKQFMVYAVVTESYSSRLKRAFWKWLIVLLLVATKLVKVILSFEIDQIADVIDLIADSVTKLAEAPEGLMDMLENGLPVGGGVGDDEDSGFGSLQTNENDVTGAMEANGNDMTEITETNENDVTDAMKGTKLDRDTRLKNKEAQFKEATKYEKVTELVEKQGPAIKTLRNVTRQ
ncbi:hypothetical protein PHYPSEUDO_004456 [Phytophthora pseudosyringae]|uniref:Uncharacterized protein n=1 Tax=Phytophthora pseudosyringae TaxID=221518 RepID=A0A8T1WNZ3_9STRA|nr:hypothetical protein PHYPSEUDO_004456 [Phytophthora pseudosyringae]